MPPPWLERPTLSINLDQPLKKSLAAIPGEVIASAQRLLAAVMREIPPAARIVADAVRLRTANRFQAEAVAFAEIVGASWRDCVLANVSYDLMLAHIGCSTVALPTPSGPVLARNMDWWPEDLLAQASYLFRYESHGELKWAQAGWPGSIGVVTGLSARGFAVALNAVLSPEGSSKTGYPVLLHLRRVLEDAASFEEALAMLRDQRLASPALITLVGNTNEQRVVVERTPTRHALRWGESGKPLLATNDYRLLFPPQRVANEKIELYATTCDRYAALQRLLAEFDFNQEIDDARLLYVLTDPAVIQGITAQHVLLRPQSGGIRLFAPRRLVQP